MRWTYGYNAARQVTSDSVSDAAYTWGPPQTTSIAYTTNALNQYVTVGGVSVAYNANGNETTDQRGHSYTYDAENVLRGATGIATYQYYADGTRRQKTVSGALTQYLYTGDQEIAEYDGVSGALLRRYLRLPGSTDEPFLMIDMTQPANDRERWVHQNRQGSTVALTNASGAVTNQFRYDAYGRVGTEGASGFPFRYTGQRIDAETGLYYYKARYYDADTGRFLQIDPVGYTADLDLYAYVGNDPLNRTDPTGNCPMCLAIPFVCAGGGCEAIFLGIGGLIIGHQLVENSHHNEQSAPPPPPSNEQAQPRPQAPPLPGGLVGDDQSKPRGGRVNSGPLAPEHGGTGDAGQDFGHLTGGTGAPAPAGSRLPEGSQVGDNGVILRPPAAASGPRIDIPANGDKPHETLHYPPPPPDPQRIP